MSTISTFAQENNELSTKIIAMEKAALDELGKGNPTAFLNIYAKDIVYFDPFLEQRLDGLDKLTALYESIRGKVHFDRFELINPHVQSAKDMAVLTFNYVSYAGTSTDKWNCTEVYRLEKDGTWKIIQSHWSQTKPGK